MEYMKKKLSLKEALDYLEDILSDEEDENLPTAIVLEPPDNEEGISGEDDGPDDYYGLPDNVCPAQLKSGCEILYKRNDESDIEENGENFEDDGASTNMPVTTMEMSNCTSSLSKETSALSNFKMPSKLVWCDDISTAMMPIFPEPNYEDCRNITPHEQFEKFVDYDLLNHISKQCDIYATFLQKPAPGISVEELKVYIAILLISGYASQSNMASYWSAEPDLRNELIYTSMRKNRFKQISQFLHFEENTQINQTDKMWKLRPVTDRLKANFLKHFHPEQNLSYDESMISYFGKHGCKQFIKGKPLRFGYKVWSLCTPTGYLTNFEIYQGRNPRSNTFYEQNFGKCIAPLLNMLDEFPPDVRVLPFSLYFDNLFTGFPVLTFLKSKGYDATGTIRENRIPKNCPLPLKKQLKKKERGFIISKKVNGLNIRLTKWIDNSVVSIASTVFGVNPISRALRYSKIHKKKIKVPRPCVISEYNKYMCGVDRMDQNVSLYRIGIKGKKWWSSIFTWLIDVAVQNAWLLHRISNPEIRHLNFRRAVALYYCKHFGELPKHIGNRKRSADLVGIRYDRMDHYVCPVDKKKTLCWN